MNKWTGKTFVLIALFLLSVGLITGCGAKEETKNNAPAATTETTAPQAEAAEATPEAAAELEGDVTSSGSSALLPLVKQAATEFMEKNAKVTVNVTAGGSGTGLKNVAGGISDIGNSDVAAGDEYKDSNLVDHVVAIAPFAIIVNKDVNVDSLTKEQAAKIFKGEITNWKEVGGNDKSIVIVHRPDSSGSRKLVKQIVLDGQEFTKDGVVQENSGAVKTAVAGTSGTIGYVDAAYIDDTLKALKFDGFAFSPETIKDGSYKLFGIEHMYTKGEPTGAVKAFLDYILSDEFQSTRVEELKFLPASFLK